MSDAITYRAFLLELPLRSPIPVGGQQWQSRPVVLMRGEDQNGNVAWGEAAPLDGYGPDRLDQVIGSFTASDTAPETPSLAPTLACAMGTVRLGLRAAGADVRLGDLLGRIEQEEFRPAHLGSETTDVQGKHVVKIKVGIKSQVEVDRVSHMLSLNAHRNVRLDGNGQLSKEDALQFLDRLGAYRDRIEYFEEPFPGCFASDHRSDFPVPLAIDESLDSDNWRNADVCVIKPSLMGDPLDTMTLASDMQHEGRRVVVSSAFESAVGMTMLSWVAACLGDAAPGLGTYRYIADDLGGRSNLWDVDSVKVTDLPPYPVVSDAALKSAHTAALGYAGSTGQNDLHIEELTIREGSWLTR